MHLRHSSLFVFSILSAEYLPIPSAPSSSTSTARSSTPRARSPPRSNRTLDGARPRRPRARGGRGADRPRRALAGRARARAGRGRRADRARPRGRALRGALRADASAPTRALFPGVMPGLRRCARRASPMSVVTNKPRFFTEMLLERLEVARFFDGGRRGRRRHPPQARRRHARWRRASAWASPPGETLMLGDSDNDVARRARRGLPGVVRALRLQRGPRPGDARVRPPGRDGRGGGALLTATRYSDGLSGTQEDFVKSASRLLALTACCAFGLALAQGYPNKPIKVVVPWPPGQATDTVARVVADKMSTQMSSQLVIDNRPGAGGTLGSHFAAKSAPDGYTILAGSSGPISISPRVQKVPYDPDKDFEPICLMASTTYVLVSHPSFPAKDYAEFVSTLKANPGKYNFASSGTGADRTSRRRSGSHSRGAAYPRPNRHTSSRYKGERACPTAIHRSGDDPAQPAPPNGSPAGGGGPREPQRRVAGAPVSRPRRLQAGERHAGARCRRRAAAASGRAARDVRARLRHRGARGRRRVRAAARSPGRRSRRPGGRGQGAAALQEPFELTDGEARISASIGTALHPRDGADARRCCARPTARCTARRPREVARDRRRNSAAR